MSRGTGAARRGGRVGVALATAGLVALPLTAAQAVVTPGDEPVEVSLSPEVVGSFLVPVETLPGFDPSARSATDFFNGVPVAPAGEVTISLPPGVDVPDAGALSMYSGLEALDPTFSLEASEDGPLTAGVEGRTLVVGLPDAEYLPEDLDEDVVISVPVTGGGLPAGEELFYYLDLGSSVGTDTLELAPVLLTETTVPGAEVAVGGDVRLVLPGDPALGALGVTSLEPVLVGLRAAEDYERSVPAPAVAVADDGASALVTLSPETPADEYDALLALQPRSDDGEVEPQLLVQVGLPLTVLEADAEPAPAPSAEPTATPTAAPAPPAEKPRQNEGLRSNTGVEETGTSTTALVAGGGVLLLGLAAGAALLRRRTQR